METLAGIVELSGFVETDIVRIEALHVTEHVRGSAARSGFTGRAPLRLSQVSVQRDGSSHRPATVCVARLKATAIHPE